MAMNDVKAVFFDLDNTLCDYWGSSRQALTQALNLAVLHHPNLDGETLRRDYFRVQREAEAAGAGLARVERFSAALARHGVQDDALAATLADLYEDHLIAGLAAFPDALTVLNHLMPRYPLGLLTNGPGPLQRRKLDILGIGPRFSHTVISEEVGLAKPDPAIFRYALALAGVRPDEALFIGDSPEHDVAGARAAGVTVVWVNRRARAFDPSCPEPDHVVTHLLELLPLLGHDLVELEAVEGSS